MRNGRYRGYFLFRGLCFGVLGLEGWFRGRGRWNDGGIFKVRVFVVFLVLS